MGLACDTSAAAAARYSSYMSMKVQVGDRVGARMDAAFEKLNNAVVDEDLPVVSDKPARALPCKEAFMCTCRGDGRKTKALLKALYDQVVKPCSSKDTEGRGLLQHARLVLFLHCDIHLAEGEHGPAARQEILLHCGYNTITPYRLSFQPVTRASSAPAGEPPASEGRVYIQAYIGIYIYNDYCKDLFNRSLIFEMSPFTTNIKELHVPKDPKIIQTFTTSCRKISLDD
jgi:hypothetical protein